MRKRGCLNRSTWRFLQVFGISCGIAALLILVQGDMTARRANQANLAFAFSATCGGQCDRRARLPDSARKEVG